MGEETTPDARRERPERPSERPVSTRERGTMRGMGKKRTLNQVGEAVHPEGWEVRDAYSVHHLPCRDCRRRRE
jgi:hypothetical protein